MKNHIIFFSGGKSSFAVVDYVKSNYPEDNIVLYFTDTKFEDEDLYRFINDVSDSLQLPLLIHADGRTPIELMFEQKCVFNSRIGQCSKILKMKVADDFIRKGIKPNIEEWRNKQYLKKENFTESPTLYFGIGFDEFHRTEAIERNWQPFEVKFPLVEYIIDNNTAFKKWDIKIPYLYSLGFTHNNCGGRCVKAGQAHFKNLKEKLPERFRKLAEMEWHLKTYVSSYHYIKGMETEYPGLYPDGIDPHLEEFKKRELQSLDDKFRDYFYGRAERPKMHWHPAVTGTCENFDKFMFQRFSFMKKQKNNNVGPYMLRDFLRDLQEQERIERETGVQLNMFDLLDFGGCGCFVDYDTQSLPNESCQLQMA